MSNASLLRQNNDSALVIDRDSAPDARRRWVTTLFVTFRYSVGNANGRDDGLLNQYHTILEQAVGFYCGDVVAISNQEALVVFAGSDASRQAVQNAVASASSMLDQVRESNMQRLAEDLTPLRLGIGLDAGSLAACNRHPRLDPALQAYVEKARRLSDLNCQTPFPTVFVSHAVASNVDATQRYAIQNLGTVLVEKQADPMTVYALMDREAL